MSMITYEGEGMWDVFICHASEDKDSIVRPLATALSVEGLSVWYDEFTLTLGDSLRRSIDIGLAGSRYGIVILSPHFLTKSWPQRELDGLTTKELSSGKTILPVWHNVTKEQVERFSLPLADKLAVSTSNGLGAIVRAVLQVIRPGLPSQLAAASPISRGMVPQSSSSIGSATFDLAEYQVLVEYAFSPSGLNLPTRQKAAEWVDAHRELLDECGFDRFKQLVEYAFSSSGLNFPTRQKGAEWAAANWELLNKHGFDRFKELVEYAFSSSGLNLPTRQKASEWAISRLK